MGFRGEDNNTYLPISLIKNTLKPTSVTVGTATTLLPTAPLSNRTVIDIYNNSLDTEILLMGIRPIEPKASLRLNITASVTLWATVSSGSAEAIILEGS